MSSRPLTARCATMLLYSSLLVSITNLIQTKSALTRAYNKEVHVMPYGETDTKKAKRATLIGQSNHDDCPSREPPDAIVVIVDEEDSALVEEEDEEDEEVAPKPKAKPTKKK